MTCSTALARQVLNMSRSTLLKTALINNQLCCVCLNLNEQRRLRRVVKLVRHYEICLQRPLLQHAPEKIEPDRHKHARQEQFEALNTPATEPEKTVQQRLPFWHWRRWRRK